MEFNVTDALDVADYFFKNYSYRLMDFLPLSPQISSDFFTMAQNSLGWLNWFFPVGRCLDFMGATLGGIALVYASRFVLRKLGVIT